MRQALALLALATLLPVASARGQSTLIQASQQQKLDVARRATVDPNVETPYALAIPSVSLETTKEEGRAKATIGWAASETNYRFTFESPIGKAADSEANPLSLTGLGNDATAEFAFSKTFLFKRYRDEDVLAFCARNGVTVCSDQAFKDDAAKRREFLGLAIREHPSLVSVSAQIGAPAFEYRNVTTLEKTERKLTSHKITASYAVIFLPRLDASADTPSASSLLSFNLTHSRSYAASKDKTSLCTPITGTPVAGATRCDDVILGEPKPDDVWGLTLEYRRQIVRKDEGVPRFGISPRINLNLDDLKESSLEVPIYFLQKAPTKEAGASLNGGVNTGWSKKAGYVVKVFVGAGFQLISR